MTQIDRQSVVETIEGSLKYKLGFTVGFLFLSLTLLYDVFLRVFRFSSLSINFLFDFVWLSLICSLLILVGSVERLEKNEAWFFS